MTQTPSVQPRHWLPTPGKWRLTCSCLALAGMLLVSAPAELAACQFHTSLSGDTLSRQIADSIEIAAMRPSAESPFRFEPVEHLKGARSHSVPPHLVDSTTRRRLAQNPDQAVLFARGTNGMWQRLMFLDDDRRRIAEQLLANADDWAVPSGEAGKRDYFAALLGRADNNVQLIALRELDAVSYPVLRGGSYPIAVQDLLSGISDLRSLAYAPIRILLIGVVGGADAERAIGRRLKSMAALGTAFNLGAWITADIETRGRKAVEDLRRNFFQADRQLSRLQLDEIVRALAVHSASNEDTLRPALDTTIRQLVELYPESAPMVARTFAMASDWSQASLMRDLMAKGAMTTAADLMVTAAYLAGAAQPGGSGQDATVRAGLPVAPLQARP